MTPSRWRRFWAIITACAVGRGCCVPRLLPADSFRRRVIQWPPYVSCGILLGTPPGGRLAGNCNRNTATTSGTWTYERTRIKLDVPAAQ